MRTVQSSPMPRCEIRGAWRERNRDSRVTITDGSLKKKGGRNRYVLSEPVGSGTTIAILFGIRREIQVYKLIRSQYILHASFDKIVCCARTRKTGEGGGES